MEDEYIHLMTFDHYGKMKGVTQQCVRYWVDKGKVVMRLVDGRKFVHLTPEEIKERKERGM